MAGLCGHFVAMTHRMLRFLECSYITERKFTRKLVAMPPQTTLVGV